MRELYEQTNLFIKDVEKIAANLFAYNPGSGQKKVPLENIQHDVATLTKDLTGLYADIGKIIREEKE